MRINLIFMRKKMKTMRINLIFMRKKMKTMRKYFIFFPAKAPGSSIYWTLLPPNPISCREILEKGLGQGVPGPGRLVSRISRISRFTAPGGWVPIFSQFPDECFAGH